jgi:hypothetical protein
MTVDPSASRAASPPRLTVHARRAVNWWTAAFGVDLRGFLLGLRGMGPFVRDMRRLTRANRKAGSPWRIELTRPCLADRYEQSGTASGHYFHQDLLVARRIFAKNPERHVDVGSRVDGLVAHVAAFRPIEVMDVRPLSVDVPNIVFRTCDLMNVPGEFSGCCDSLSCLHVLEHVGLGRYGDTIDLFGYVAGLDGLRKLLRPGGTLYLSLPIGRERVEFNGHRVFSIGSMLSLFEGKFELGDFSYVDDEGALHESVPLTVEALEGSFGLEYGCGIFELRKLS